MAAATGVPRGPGARTGVVHTPRTVMPGATRMRTRRRRTGASKLDCALMSRSPALRFAMLVSFLAAAAGVLPAFVAPPLARAGVTGLPTEHPFAPLTADPTEVRLGFDWIEGGQLAAYTGRRLGLARFGTGPRAAVLSADGMLWARISSRPHFTFPLQTVDGAFGVSLDRARGAWSERLRWGHHSGHFGDGAQNLAKRAFVYSRETMELLAAWAPGARVRLYAGPLFTVRADPRASAFQWITGGELRAPRTASARTVPYAAWHLDLKAENANRVNQSYELGLRLVATSRSSARFIVGYFDGVSERGQ